MTKLKETSCSGAVFFAVCRGKVWIYAFPVHLKCFMDTVYICDWIAPQLSFRLFYCAKLCDEALIIRLFKLQHLIVTK